MKHQKAFSRTLLLVALILGMCVGLTAPRMEKVQAAPLFANPLDVVISEIAWAGTSSSTTSDEWIELYNNTSSAVNLSGWTLSSNDASPNINLSGTIPAFGYFLLEADDDFTISNITADLIYTGALNNTGEALTLRDSSSNIIDTANSSGGAWPAGTAGSPAPTYSTMSRKSPITADSALAWSSNTTNGTGKDANNQPIKGDPHNSSIDLSVSILPVPIINSTVGGTVNFDIQVTNNGFGTATNIEIKNNIPLLTELTYQSSTLITGTYDNTTGIWAIPSLAYGATETLTITVIVGASGTKTVWAQVWKSDQKDPNSTPANNVTAEDDFSYTTLTTPISGTADLSVTKSVNNSTPSVNDNVVFTITVNNLGTDTATSVVIKDIISGGLAYISDNGGGTYLGGTLNEWQAGTIASGGSKSIKITARVLPTGPYQNSANVSSLGQNDPNPANDISPTITLAPSGGISDLRLTQSYAKASPAVAGNVVLSITVSNSGPYNATNVIIKDKLPSGLTYVSDDSGGTYSKDTGLWSTGAVTTTTPRTLQITAKVDTSGTLTNWAEVWAVDQFDPNSTPGNSSTTEDDDASVTVESADLSITKVMNNANPAVGQDVVFTITVSNAGPNTATNVKVKDVLPSNYTYSSDDSGGNYIGGFWTVGSIPNGASRTLKITATLATGALSINWAEVWTADQIDIDSVPGNSSTNTDDDASAPSADLRVDQTVSNAFPAANTNFDFVVTVTNDGPVGTTDVQVKDLLPSGVTYVSYTSTLGTYVNTTGIWTVGTLPLNGSATLTITAKVSGASGVITNWAEVYKSDLPDTDSTAGNGSTTEDDDASGVVYFRPVLINEVAWAGTYTSLPNDQWVELYNPTSVAMNITGWKLQSSGGLNMTLAGTIPSGGYFLIEWTNNNTITDITASQIYTGGYILSASGEILTLVHPTGTTIDTANGNGGAWPKGGGGTNPPSMERVGNTVESDASWVANTGVTKNGTSANGAPIYGTPGRSNSTGIAPTPTITPAPQPTPYHYSTPFVPLVGRPIINEFLPRPNFDWNQDGRVDVFDEFIEITNAGPVDISIGGWQLDDEQNLGSNPYTIPSMTLKPGERVVFYGSTTNILLGDGGDTVRLISNNGKIYDAYTYKIAKVEDQSWCRIPDGSDWYDDCTPTPTIKNTRNGTIPSMPDENYQSPVCNLPDTLPIPFLIAECRGYGKDIWQMIWDPAGWFLIRNHSKWDSFVE
jgi:uncharacterized repeat protein (TIGR01451 family)